MKNFRELKVWQKAHALTQKIYTATTRFPKEEQYALTSQMRRAAVSIPSNIAEGCGRGSDADFGRFLQIAMGSACELEYHLLLAADMKMLEKEKHVNLDVDVSEIKKMLSSLLRKLKADR
jgi:four helix bundle protein